MEAEAPFVKPLYLVSGIDTPVGIIVLTALQGQEHHQLQVLKQGLEKSEEIKHSCEKCGSTFPSLTELRVLGSKNLFSCSERQITLGYTYFQTPWDTLWPLGGHLWFYRR